MKCYQKVFIWSLFFLWSTVNVVADVPLLLESSGYKMLSNDVASKIVGVEENGDVKLIGTGWINVTLDSPPYNLEFGLCKNKCGQKHKSIVCYPNSATGNGNDAFCTGPELSSYCGFKAEVDRQSFNFWDDDTYTGFSTVSGDCPSFVMTSKGFKAGRIPVVTCNPKIDEKNHMVQLYAIVDPSCPMWIKKARIHLPPPPPSSSSVASDSSASAGFWATYWWIILIVVIVGLIIIGFPIIGYIVYKKTNLFKSRPRRRAPSAQPSKVKSKRLSFKTALSKRSSKKKYKKTEAKQVIKTAQEPSHQASQIPPKNAVSTAEQLPDYDTPADSLNRNYQLPSEVFEEMKINYENIASRCIFDDEVAFFCVPIEAMDEAMKSFSEDGERKLESMGAEFDDCHRIQSLPSRTRAFLNVPQTPASLSYFAFGAEYHDYIPGNDQHLDKLSLPLLMVIAFQIRFPGNYRRNAMSCIRRRLPKIRDTYTVAERAQMPFPINIIELVHQKDAKTFEDLKKHAKADSVEEKSGERKMEKSSTIKKS